MAFIHQARPEHVGREVGTTHTDVTCRSGLHLPDRFSVEISFNPRSCRGYSPECHRVHNLVGRPPDLREVPYDWRLAGEVEILPRDHDLVHSAPEEVSANRPREVVDEGVDFLIRLGPIELAVFVCHVPVERRERRVDQLGQRSITVRPPTGVSIALTWNCLLDDRTRFLHEGIHGFDRRLADQL